MSNKSSEEGGGGSGGMLMIMVTFMVMFFAMKYLLFPNKEADEANEQSAAVGKVLQNLQLQPLTGDAKPLGLSDLQGKVTLINYWGFWCPPCRVEFPHLVEIAGDFQNEKDFQFVSVSTSNNPEPGDETEIAEVTTEFLKTQGATFPTYCDPWHKSRTFLGETLGMEGFGYPTTVLIDRQGAIAGFWTGYKPGLEKEIAIAVAKEVKKESSGSAKPAEAKAEKAKPAEVKSAEPAKEEPAKETPAKEAAAPAEAAK